MTEDREAAKSEGQGEIKEQFKASKRPTRKSADVPVETPISETKTLTSTTPEETKATGTVRTGAVDKWLCIAKAVNEAEGWMKSTKAMQVGAAGCLIQVTTQQRNPDGSYTVAEAVCFAERVNLTVEGDVAKLI